MVAMVLTVVKIVTVAMTVLSKEQEQFTSQDL